MARILALALALIAPATAFVAPSARAAARAAPLQANSLPLNGWEPDSSKFAYGLPGTLDPVPDFDPAGLSADVSLDDIKLWREAEVTHGRVSMLAVVGFLTQENFHFLFVEPDNIGPATATDEVRASTRPLRDPHVAIAAASPPPRPTAGSTRPPRPAATASDDHSGTSASTCSTSSPTPPRTSPRWRPRSSSTAARPPSLASSRRAGRRSHHPRHPAAGGKLAVQSPRARSLYPKRAPVRQEYRLWLQETLLSYSRSRSSGQSMSGWSRVNQNHIDGVRANSRSVKRGAEMKGK